MKKAAGIAKILGGCCGMIVGTCTGFVGLLWVMAEHPDEHNHIVSSEVSRYTPLMLLIGFGIGTLSLYFVLSGLVACFLSSKTTA